MVFDTKLYDLLGVSSTVTQDELKKAYRKLSLKFHPDKCTHLPEKEKKESEAKFVEITNAMEILSDPETRKIYDQYGENAAKKRANSDNVPHDPFNFFDSFFGQKQKQFRDYTLDVTLAEVYHLSSKTFTFFREECCEICSGTKTKNGKRNVCEKCQGQGKIMMRHGVMTQIMQCPDCGGDGEKISETDKCDKCNGYGIKLDGHEITVNITPQKYEYFLGREGDYSTKNQSYGDLRVTLNVEKSNGFEINQDRLIFKKKLNLLEALTGFSFKIGHPCGDTIVFNSEKGLVTPPFASFECSDLGMPLRNGKYSSLIIETEIEFPKKLNLTPEQQDVFNEALGSFSHNEVETGDRTFELKLSQIIGDNVNEEEKETPIGCAQQ